MTRWPRDNQAELIAFYGDPGSRGARGVGAQLAKVTPPFQMYYDGKPLKTLSFHKKAAPALMAALDEIWEHYGRDQATIDRLGISSTAGTYNPRKVRGSATKWSNHAYGAAIDINASENGFGKGKGNIPQPVIDAFKHQGARWGGDYKGRTDPMHFEFCYAGPSRPVSLMDTPQGDADSDAGELPHEVDGDETDQPKRGRVATFMTSVKTWLTSGGIATVAGGLYDYRVAIVLGVVAVIIFTIVWFTYLRKQL